MEKPYNTNYNTIKNSDYTANKDQAMINDITHELRNFANSGMSAMECATYSDKLIAIADRIQLEHERLMVERADRYSELRVKMNNCYIELPKDADGVPWNPGDRDEDGNEVFELVLNSDGWYLVNGTKWVNKADSIRHHHAPTVEDVLLEACKAYHGLMIEGISDFAHDMPAPSEIIAEYAVKLQLKED